MAAIKTVTMTVRLSPAVKKSLMSVAEQEHRSIANMVEIMILDYCGRNGITISDQLPLVTNKSESSNITAK